MSLRHNTADALNRAIAVTAPPSRVPPSEWIEANITIPAEESARPGLMSLDAYPYWRPVVDWLDDDDVEMIVVEKPSQVGWTTLLTAAVGYSIECDPSRTLVCMATQGEAEIFSKDRLMPIIEATPALEGKIKPAKSRDAQNTILHKRGPGFSLKITYATSASALASWPAKRVFVDEVDRFKRDVGNEGDPIAMIRKRCQTYLKMGGKILIGSSPGRDDLSIVHPYYEQGSRSLWLCPCHHCGHEQDLSFDNVTWDVSSDGKPLAETAAYHCPECGGVWSDIDRLANIRAGRISESEPNNKIKSIHIKGLHSPHVTVQEIAAKLFAVLGDPAGEQTVYNTDLGLTYRQKGEAPDAERLYERRESYPMGVVPRGGLILMAAADVQRDRIEVEVSARGYGDESWSIEHIILQGDVELDQVWRDLSNVIRRSWPGANGEVFRLARFLIDSGFATDRVYAWAEGQRDTRIYVGKGQDGLPVAVGRPSRPKVDHKGKTKKRGVQLWPIGSSYCKAAVYSRLRLAKPEDDDPCPRYMHFPQYDREWFEQLASEQRVSTTDNKGYSKVVWQKTRPRNEGLDLSAYNFAMACHMGIENWTDEQWGSVLTVPVQAAPQQSAAQPAGNYLQGGGRGSWLGGRR